MEAVQHCLGDIKSFPVQQLALETETDEVVNRPSHIARVNEKFVIINSEFSTTTWAPAFVSFTQRSKRSRLRQSHDGLESQWRTMSVVPVSDSPHRVAKDLNS